MQNNAGNRREVGWPRGIWAAVPTPFRADESLDLPALPPTSAISARSASPASFAMA